MGYDEQPFKTSCSNENLVGHGWVSILGIIPWSCNGEVDIQMKYIFLVLVLLFSFLGQVFSEPDVILKGEDWITWSEEDKVKFMQGYIMSNHFVLGMLITQNVLPYDSAPVRYLALVLPNTSPLSLVRDVDVYFLDKEALTHFIWMAVDLTQQKRKTPSKPKIEKQIRF